MEQIEEADYEEISPFEDETLQSIMEGNVVEAEIDFVDEDTGEILQLSEYVEPSANNNLLVVAEYENIDVVNIDKKTKKIAQDLTNKIVKFITDFDDVVLTEEHRKYIAEVGKLELSSLQDLLMLTEYNKGIIANMVHRINSVQAEDYAMIASYNQLINNQIKLNKELSTKYKSIPAVIKRMKAEVLCNQELGKDENDYVKLQEEMNSMPEIVSNKDLIRKLREKHSSM